MAGFVYPEIGYIHIEEGGKKLLLQRVVSSDANGNPITPADNTTLEAIEAKLNPKPDVVLAAAVAATPAGVMVAAGRYNLEISATTWASATATLQKLRIGGTAGTAGDWISDAVAVAAANSIWRDMPLDPGTYRILIAGGPPTGLNATLWGVS